MDETNRPNIVKVGGFAGSIGAATIAPIVVWIWNGWLVPQGAPEMDAVVGSAFGGIIAVAIGSVAQILDRATKRRTHYVLNKHGPREVREQLAENEAGVR